MWIDVGAADALASGELLTVEGADGDVVVWRSASGVLAACDARCPHQWAHLGSAGVVDGEELVCLSHHWRFTVDGTGAKLSAAGRRDEKSPIPVVAVREVDGRIELERGDHEGAVTGS